MDEAHIIEGLRKEDPDILEDVYFQYVDSAVEQVVKKQGDEIDARKNYHESLVALIENIRSEKYEGRPPIQNYLEGIVRFKWLRELKKRGKVKSALNNPKFDHQEQEYLMEELYEDPSGQPVINEAFDLLGEDCKRFLIGYFYKKSKPAELANVFNTSEEDIDRMKWVCLTTFTNRINKLLG